MVERSRRNKEDEVDDRSTRMLLATAALTAVAALFAGPANAYFVEGDGVHGSSTQSQVRQPTQSVAPGTIPYLSHGIGVDESQFSGLARERDVASHGSDTPVIPYLSQGIGVDESQFAGQSSKVDARHAALAVNGDARSGSVGLDPAIRTAIEARSNVSTAVEQTTAPLPHGIQVVMSPPSEEQQSLGLTGDSALSRVVPAEQEPAGSPSGTTYPSHVIGAGGSQWDGQTLPATADVDTTQVPQVTATSSGSDFDWASFGAGAGMAALLAGALAGLALAMRRRHTVGLP
jgi:hypothetical protein